MNEKWKEIAGYEGSYYISDHGRVKSLKCKKEKILKPKREISNGKIRITLINGKAQNHYIGRLVFEAFVRPLEAGEVVKNVDGNYYNCNLSNLGIAKRRGVAVRKPRKRKNVVPSKRMPDGKWCACGLQIDKHHDQCAECYKNELVG